jgi:CubicO group peptidase (beta-lactamase class C family)
MKLSLYRVVVGVALALGLCAPVLAQDEAAAPASPTTPIPYTVLRPQARRPAAPRPAAPRPTPAVGPAAAVASAGPADPTLEAFVDGLARDAMASDHIAGLAVAVVQNGRVTLSKGYGFADIASGRPVDGDRTLFRIGSISKTFTWISILKEVEAGRMRLDAPINIYLPERLQVRDQGFNQPVRVRDLMDHTAGFEDRALGQLFQTNPDRVRPLPTWLRQERPDRVREPGLTTAYSNYGAALAGEAVAEVVGLPFDRLAAQRILAPAGMWHTTFRQPNPVKDGLPAPMDPGLAAELSSGFHWSDGGFQARPFEFVEAAPAGAASSTAADMGRYLRLLLGGGVIDGANVYGPRTAQAIFTPLWRAAPDIPGWRHGFADYPLPGGHMGLGHTGATLLFNSNLVLAPDLDLGVFVVTNTDTGGAFVRRLPAAIVERFYGVQRSAPPRGDPSLMGRRGVYEGRYLSTMRAYGGLEGFIIGLFRAGVIVKATPDGFLTTRTSSGVRRWAPVSETRFQSVDTAETLNFDMRNGRAARMLGAVSTAERAPLWFDPGLLVTLAVLVAIGAVAALGAPLFRDRRSFRQAQVQARAGMAQIAQSALWLLSFVCFGVWAMGAGDAAALMQAWPGFWLLAASACAFVAGVLAIAVLILLPWAWRGGRRVDSWTTGRKLRFTFTAVLFAAFALILALNGALAPWNA